MNTVLNHCVFFSKPRDWVFTTAATNLTRVLLLFYFLSCVFTKPRLFSWQSLSLLTQISSDPHLFIPFSHPHMLLIIQSIFQYIYSSAPFQCLILYSVVTLALWPCCLFLRLSFLCSLWNFSSCWPHACCISSYLPCLQPAFEYSPLYTRTVTVPLRFSVSHDASGWYSLQVFLFIYFLFRPLEVWRVRCGRVALLYFASMSTSGGCLVYPCLNDAAVNCWDTLDSRREVNCPIRTNKCRMITHSMKWISRRLANFQWAPYRNRLFCMTELCVDVWVIIHQLANRKLNLYGD